MFLKANESYDKSMYGCGAEFKASLPYLAQSPRSVSMAILVHSVERLLSDESILQELSFNRFCNNFNFNPKEKFENFKGFKEQERSKEENDYASEERIFEASSLDVTYITDVAGMSAAHPVP